MENVHLKCNATGSTKAPDGVDWFFNGDVITEKNPQWYGRLVKINRKPLPGRSLISEIIIEKATMADRGYYVCRFTKQLAKGFNVHVLNGKFRTQYHITHSPHPMHKTSLAWLPLLCTVLPQLNHICWAVVHCTTHVSLMSVFNLSMYIVVLLTISVSINESFNHCLWGVSCRCR